MKIAAWNLNSIKSRLSHLRHFLQEVKPDILLLQELKCETEKFPFEELSDFAYNCYVHGQKSYNGVAILSKFRADEIINNFPGNPCPEQARFLEIRSHSPIGFCRFISVYVPNGGQVCSDKFALKLQFYDALSAYLAQHDSLDEKLIIGGDFNVAPFDKDVYSPKDLANSTCFTLSERQKLRTILNSGLEDLYRLTCPNKQEFSWWDYRAGAFEHNRGMRIDLLLASSKAACHLQRCYIDYQMRTLPSPSDHAPIIAY